jgi:hypothetical protein
LLEEKLKFRDASALRRDDFRRRIDKIAQHLSADGRVGVEQPVQHSHEPNLPGRGRRVNPAVMGVEFVYLDAISNNGVGELRFDFEPGVRRTLRSWLIIQMNPHPGAGAAQQEISSRPRVPKFHAVSARELFVSFRHAAGLSVVPTIATTMLR